MPAVSVLLRLLSPAYLYSVNETPEGLRAGPLAWALLLALGAVAAWQWRKRSGVTAEPWSGLAFWSAAVGALLALVRPLAGGLLSARVWSATLTATFAGAAVVGALYGAWVRSAIRHRVPSPRVRMALDVVTLMVLAGGVAWLSAGGLRAWWPASAGGACLALASLGGRPRRLRPLVLAPFAPACLALLAVAGLRAQGLDLGPYAAFPAPDPWSPWFDVRAMALAGALGSLVLALRAAFPRAEHTAAGVGVALAALGAVFYLASMGRHLSHGATASDPYCYLQMAIDLVEHGTVLHRFPLLGVLRAEGLSTWPAVHIGYHPPAAGDLAATVWPFGWPALMVPLLALAGEPGALWAAPLWMLLAAGLSGVAARILWPSIPRGWQWACGGLAALLLLTSLEVVLRTMVPMADAAAAALAVATLLALVRAQRSDRVRHVLVWAAGAGAALGAGYLVRHPQLPLALAALGLLLGRQSWRVRLGALAVCGGTALLVALPDLGYHRALFGSPLIPESPEGYLLSVANLRATVGPMLAEVLRRSEFGYLLPLTVYGLARSVRRADDRVVAFTMLAGLIGVVGFNLAYVAVRLRDLIGIYPWLALWTARGAVDLCRVALASRNRATVGLAVGAVVLAVAARTATISGLPGYPVWWTFGLVTAEQRTEFVRLGEALPADALVLTGLNSGAVERYAARSTLRPSRWTDDELRRFLAWAAEDGRPVYLLDDGEEAAAAMGRLGGLASLRRLGVFALQAHGIGGWPIEGGATLYRVGSLRVFEASP